MVDHGRRPGPQNRGQYAIGVAGLLRGGQEVGDLGAQRVVVPARGEAQRVITRLAALCRYAGRRRARTRKVQLMSWAASSALHLPDGPAAQRRDAYLARVPQHLAWIHSHDALAPALAPAR
jgi:hypothetical protein